MNVKLVGAIMVIVGCGGIGFKLAADLRQEIKALRDLIGILQFMECELNYRLTPLPQLCRISGGQGNFLKPLFECFADEMESQASVNISSCMEAAMHKNMGKAEKIRTYLEELGSSFGNFDLDGQLRDIESVRLKCIKRLDALEKDKDIQVRNYQTLGVCAGTALAILLF